MSASAYKLLLYLCVWTSILQANGIQNLRYPTRLDTNWRFGKRQDLLAKSRFFMWNPALASPQMYPNLKTPLSPHNFNRYSMPPPPPMAGIHHQPNYMYNVPTKMNYPPAAYMQPVKEIDEKRKPGNLHHITIINAIMPKPYLPTSPTLNHHHHNHQPTSTFRNYRANNKLLYTPQYFNNNNKINTNFPFQNMENLNKLTQHQQHLTLTQLQPQQPIQPMQMVYTSSPLTVKVNTPTMEYMNIVNYNTKVGSNNNNNDYEENEITNTVTKCGRKTKDDSNNSGSDILYYYCNNRITNYKNPAEQQQTIYNIPSTTTTNATSTTSTSSSSTTTTESPTTTTIKPRVKTTIKALDSDYDFFTTEKIPIFLPTPYTPEENSFTPIASAFRDQNSLNDLDTKVQDDFKPQRYKSRFTEYENIRPQQQRQRQSNYNNIKRQQFYTTLAPTALAESYDGMKLHSFFTIEDAVTRAPEMQVFNDPYQAYRHARRHHNNKQLRQNYQTTTTSTKEPTTTSSFPARPKFKSFFDDLDEEEYIMPENSAHYDYSLYNKPQKSSYYKANYNNENSYTQSNQILGHTYKTTIDNSYFNEDDIYLGKPKIKEHHFDLFKAITTTSTPSVTTYKPYNNLRDLFLTTPRVESSFTFNPKTITFTTTTSEAVLGNSPVKTETESTTFNPKTNELDPTTTTTSIPITTTTTRKSPRISLKTPLNLRPTNTFKYTKPRGILKSYKNLTTTTTTTTTPTLKKVSKYRRQYKGKKLKQFKHLYTTTPSTTSTSSSTTTTEIPTTFETITKRYSFRVLPTTTTTSTEQPTTRKIINPRTSITTDSTKIKKSRQQITSSSVKSNRNIAKSTRISTTPLTTTKNPNSSSRRPSHRRGNKKANIVRNDLELKTTSTTRKSGNKRRRLSVNSTSTTIKPFLTRSTATTTSTTSTTTTTPIPPPIRKLAPTTTTTTTSTTTMKSIMRIANSKARTKNNNDFKSSQIRSNVINDERLSSSRMSATSTVANINIPPLPIEIYFKKSQNAKI